MEFLFEIGTEELPAGEIDAALATLESHFRTALAGARLAHGTLRTYATPRRLALRISELAAQGETLEETVLGPAARAAFGADGAPTPAALGFARSKGADPAQLFRTDTPKGEYVALKLVREGAPAAQVLQEAANSVFTAISWKRSMRWGWSTESFSRPVHWIVALLDQTVLDVTFATIQAGRTTRGHRFMAPADIVVESPASWLEQLRSGWVIADIDERRATIRDGVARLAAEQGLTAVPDDGLVDEVIHLIEYPVPLLGRFDEALLEVPREVLITSMRTHQRYFAAESAPGKLANVFLFVSNMKVARPEVVIAGNLRVLLARLEDARFFYREDRKRSLFDRVKDLDRVVYIDRIGSVGDRSRRIHQLSDWLAPRLYTGDGEVHMAATRAATLCKADLVTGMVGEFPELQGIMGRYYARASGESHAVAVAIDEHYAPRNASDEPAASPAGIVVSLAEKFDAIAGCFALGLVPSGSADPYALRRAALGIVRTLISRGLRLSLDDALGVAWDQLQGSGLRERATVVSEAGDFIRARLRAWLAADYPTDIVDAVVAVVGIDIPSAPVRCAELHRLRTDADFEPLAAAYKRAVNIVRKAEDDGSTIADTIDAALFEAPAEHALATALRDVDARSAADVDAGDFASAASVLVSLKAPIDAFFDAVLVNAPDVAVRANRLGLLRQIRRVFERFADLSRIQVSQS